LVPVGLDARKVIATIREHGAENIALIAQRTLALGFLIEECELLARFKAQKPAATAQTPSA
jgi:carbamoylphosphate synthase small subunit